MLILPGDSPEGLDHVEAALALKVGANEQEGECLGPLPPGRPRHREAWVEDGELVRIGAPADVHVTRPLGEDVGDRDLLEREQSVVDPEGMVDPLRSPVTTTHPL